LGLAVCRRACVADRGGIRHRYPAALEKPGGEVEEKFEEKLALSEKKRLETVHTSVFGPGPAFRLWLR
jgi:hypothetical protein